MLFFNAFNIEKFKENFYSVARNLDISLFLSPRVYAYPGQYKQ